ncbi:hypothetical protein KY317_01660 [Candidatus Woesearchaeota archaeon]|nr:hypothetical protein [Candidatus Woesearchaeota archaeon]
MVTEEYIQELSRHFSDRDEALIRLDSMAFLASEKGLDEEQIKRHLKDMCDIARFYPNMKTQVEVIKILENIYGTGINNPESAISRYISRQSENDPVLNLYHRLIGHRARNRGIPGIKELQDMAKKEIHDSLPEAISLEAVPEQEKAESSCEKSLYEEKVETESD